MRSEMVQNEGLLLCFSAPDTDLSVIVDDDGRVAYAYLKRAEEVVGDVWLYNVAPTPHTSVWSDRSQLPFLNPADLSLPHAGFRLTAATALEVAWRTDSADLFANGEWLATLQVGMKPGWSRYARVDGPLARTKRAVAFDPHGDAS